MAAGRVWVGDRRSACRAPIRAVRVVAAIGSRFSTQDSWQVQAMLAGAFDADIVTGMPHDTRRGIVPQHALNAAREAEPCARPAICLAKSGSTLQQSRLERSSRQAADDH